MSQTVQGNWNDLALHTIGWRAFQDLCGQVCETIFKTPVEAYRETGDQGQDGFLYLGGSKRSPAMATTLQCKHSSVPNRAAKLTDLTQEERSIRKLVQDGRAEAYIFMTSCSLDSSTAALYRAYLTRLGVTRPHVFGKQFIVRAIRSSARLRALVPQVYGLGDLSIIMDHRKADQTRKILDHWLNALQAYVPTQPHREAVRALIDHGIVLLLGNPATGKSTLAAVLTTLASESQKGTRYKVSGAKQLVERWNPNEKGGFYWVDDAFGSNQLRDDYISDWSEAFEDLSVALAAGNKFVLTSRRHIYEGAKSKLGTKNLHVFSTGSAVVQVDKFTNEEKSRILYNLVKFGNQPKSWKNGVKGFLGEIASNDPFVPGIIKRLADLRFTRNLPRTKESFLGFLREPKTYLIEVIAELTGVQQAALSLIFVHNGLLPTSSLHSELALHVSEIYGVDKLAIEHALNDMVGSFVVKSTETGLPCRIYEHPTILDAVTEYIRRKDSMLDLFVEGASVSVILENVVCDGSIGIQDAMVLPEHLNSRVIERIIGSEDNVQINSAIFSFIARRASISFNRNLMERMPSLFRRVGYYASTAASDSRIVAAARVHELGLLDQDIRREISTKLGSRLEDASDSFILEKDEILSLIAPKQLLAIGGQLILKTIPSMPAMAEIIGEEADLDGDPEDAFSDLLGFLNNARDVLGPNVPDSVFEEAKYYIEEALKDLTTRKEEKEEEEDRKRRKNEAEEEEEDAFSFSRASNASVSEPRPSASIRSLFDDVDE